MSKQSPSTVLARKLAVAQARFWTRNGDGETVKPNFDQAFQYVYSNSSPDGRRHVTRWIEALDMNMDMIATAQYLKA